MHDFSDVWQIPLAPWFFNSLCAPEAENQIRNGRLISTLLCARLCYRYKDSKIFMNSCFTCRPLLIWQLVLISDTHYLATVRVEDSTLYFAEMFPLVQPSSKPIINAEHNMEKNNFNLVLFSRNIMIIMWPNTQMLLKHIIAWVLFKLYPFNL